MSNVSLKGIIPASFSGVTGRSQAYLYEDEAAVRALVQAAVNVENFTIPLYLATMSSIQGTHEISNPLTKGRLWPGMSTTRTTHGVTLTPNQYTYNTIFSVFVQEMLHLQIAANLATVLGVKPKFFKGTVLESKDHGWACFGSSQTVIPHIIDLQDTNTFAHTKVNLAALNRDQLNLFLAVEQSHDAALKDVKHAALDKYFPAVPFANWTAKNTEADLPMFGTIGWMYSSLLQYLAIEYDDCETLWTKMFSADNLDKQRDLFNYQSSSNPHHPRSEYPLMPTLISASDPDLALLQAIDMIHGVVNQGEGGIENALNTFRLHVQSKLSPHVAISETLALKDDVTDNRVERRYQPDRYAMQKDYPGESGNVDARAHGDMVDHWDRFNHLLNVIDDPAFNNFAQWFAAGNVWTGADLQTSDYVPDPKLPTPDNVAKSLNAMKTAEYQQLLTQLNVGAIDGINAALTTSWTDNTSAFPMAAMRAVGDRMSLYWAVFGEAPDLSKKDSAPMPAEDDTHACQGLSTVNPGNNCAALSTYHTCSGSNACKGQGGCGYPNQGQGSANYIAPSDNTCSLKGGCASPISVWQIYGVGGTMDILDIDSGAAIPPGTLPFKINESVYSAAWQAYTAVMQSKGKAAGPQPEANPLRVVLPPN